MPSDRKSRSRSWSLDSLGRKKRRKSHRRHRSRSPRTSHRSSRTKPSSSSSSRSHRWSRSRSRSPERRRQKLETLAAQDFRSRILQGGNGPNKVADKVEGNEAELADELTEEDQMKALLGFGGFDSTKGKQVEANNDDVNGTVRKSKKKEYRQYMNRRGGFNRPLDGK